MNEENLKEKFPISVRWIYQRVILSFLILFGLLFSIFKLEEAGIILDASSHYRSVSFYGFVVLAIFLLYSIFYRSRYEYKIIGDEIIICRGVFIKKPVGIPLSKINAIHIKRKLHEIIFGISTVVIVVPGDISTDLSSIAGLGLKDAEAFKADIFTKN